MTESTKSPEQVEQEAIMHRSRHEKAAHRIAALSRDVDAAVSFHPPAGIDLTNTQSFKDANTVLKDRLTTVDMEVYQHYVDHEETYRELARAEDEARAKQKNIAVEQSDDSATQIDVQIVDPGANE